MPPSPPSRTVAATHPPGSRTVTAAPPPASSRAAATNRPASRWDTNTKTGRRCRDLYKSYLKALGNPDDPATQAAVMACAEQVVIAERARSELLVAGSTTKTGLELVIRAENLANRTLKRLKLDKPVTAPRKTFQEKMAEKEAALRAAEAVAAAAPHKGGAE
jgi:hypothetical protein